MHGSTSLPSSRRWRSLAPLTSVDFGRVGVAGNTKPRKSITYGPWKTQGDFHLGSVEMTLLRFPYSLHRSFPSTRQPCGSSSTLEVRHEAGALAVLCCARLWFLQNSKRQLSDCTNPHEAHSDLIFILSLRGRKNRKYFRGPFRANRSFLLPAGTRFFFYIFWDIGTPYLHLQLSFP